MKVATPGYSCLLSAAALFLAFAVPCSAKADSISAGSISYAPAFSSALDGFDTRVLSMHTEPSFSLDGTSSTADTPMLPAGAAQQVASAPESPAILLLGTGLILTAVAMAAKRSASAKLARSMTT